MFHAVLTAASACWCNGILPHRGAAWQEGRLLLLSSRGVINYLTLCVKPTFKRGHYAVDTLEVRSKIGRFATCNGNAKSGRAFPRGNGVYCLMYANKLSTTRPVAMSLGSSSPWTTCSPRRGCSSAGTDVGPI